MLTRNTIVLKNENARRGLRAGSVIRGVYMEAAVSEFSCLWVVRLVLGLFIIGAAVQGCAGLVRSIASVELERSGKSYTVERTDALAPPSWSNVSTVSATADGLKSVSVAIPSNKPTGYYRVKTTE